ncbi:muscle-specific protein 20-like [Brevipalpus obovatus]|uniref:muscle-specific protein 20-like n=1 Tax=Brevipalpus obovatus TaxID=246614 RepID=UPI003D9E3C30
MSIQNPNAAPGLHYETTKSMASKRDPELETKILKWIGEIIGEKVPPLGGMSYEETLADGVILCKLMNKLKPDSVKKFDQEPKHAFNIVENIHKFVKAAKEYGVGDDDVFQTVDLTEKRNIPMVTATMIALGRACHQHPEFKGPHIAAKPAEANPRKFSDKQTKDAAAMGALAL